MAYPIPSTLRDNINATKVEYVQLGASGLRVSYPILGGMTLGSKAWENWMSTTSLSSFPCGAGAVLDEQESLAVLKAAYDVGINTWDTANAYSNGKSEIIMGKALKQFGIPREKVTLMTNLWAYVGEDDNINAFVFGPQMEQTAYYVNHGGLSRAAIFNAVEKCLARLETTYVDVLQIHRFDPTTPIEETMKALHDLVQSGKVRYLGASSMWTYQFVQLQHVAEKNGWTKFVSMQNLYNLTYREEEREMNKFCKETGVGIIPWSPMHGGQLARPLGKGDSIRATTPHPMTPTLTDVDEEIIQRVEKVAREKEWSMSEVALTWLRSKGTVPIVGFNSVARVTESAGLRGKVLSEEAASFLEQPYVAKNILGHF